MSSVAIPVTSSDQISTSKIWMVILASSVGTMIEWYDFYIFGSLAFIISPKFYPPGNNTFAFIAYLSTFAVGFMVRPFGALFFGRIGDLVGRKYAFLVTLTIMGFGTFLIGLMPTYASIGWFAPIGLIAIRVFQGLALGGEYGGAAIYVAEHVPDNRRGYWTSFIQITATLGLFLSVITVVLLQFYMDPKKFQDFGWRIPFLLSVILVMISLYIRLKMAESPIFTQIKSTGMSSAQPLKDAFTQWPNLKLVLISLLGATAGQGVVWYTGQYYALFYLQTIIKVNPRTGYIIVAIAMLIGMPFFTLFGWLSDKIGRKKIIMAGCLLAFVTYYPIYHAMQKAAGNNVDGFVSKISPATKSPTLTPMTTDPATGKSVPAKEAPLKMSTFYDLSDPNLRLIILLVLIQVIYVTMVYGPIAAYLVEAFPAKIRYSSFSLPYHIGNGVFGGLVPLTGIWMCYWTGNIYAGLWYPMAIAAMTFVVGSILLKETVQVKIWTEVGAKK
ncbi:MAG TPA: MFS transporter [Candidatus Angelobacter sp.]|jgi:MFS family permease|nr:MFS transporter [Candidatus Angelobacter sp.]